MLDPEIHKYKSSEFRKWFLFTTAVPKTAIYIFTSNLKQMTGNEFNLYSERGFKMKFILKRKIYFNSKVSNK